MFGKATKQEKMDEFVKALQEARLEAHLEALKGGEGAVQLQSLLRLKRAAKQGPEALLSALEQAGIEESSQREAMAAFLMERVQREGGFGLKSQPASDSEAQSEAWKQGLANEEGDLPMDLEAHRQHTQDVPLESESGVQIDESGDVWTAGMNIVNGHLAQSIRKQGMIQEPNTYGYIHLAAEVEAPHPFKKNSKRKDQILGAVKEAARRLQQKHPEAVQRADVFDAFIVPPGSKEGRAVLEKGNYDVHIAEFDIVVLVECKDLAAAQSVRESESFAELKEILDREAHFVHCITGKNAKRIAEVDKTRDGVFLFNYFFAADIEQKGSSGIDILLSVWEYTAGWWTAYANLTNSTPILAVPAESSQYTLINHCRWDKALDIFPHLVFRPSLDQFVLKNFTANDIMAMPVLYHLA